MVAMVSKCLGIKVYIGNQNNRLLRGVPKYTKANDHSGIYSAFPNYPNAVPQLSFYPCLYFEN